MYIDGKIEGVIEYDLYEYNSSGQLFKIKKFHANAITGFFSLGNYIYFYSGDGKLEKKTVETDNGYVREYFIYEYKDNKPVKIKKFDDKNELESYIENQYDSNGKLIKEASFAYDGHAISHTIHSYSGSLLKDLIFIREMFICVN